MRIEKQLKCKKVSSVNNPNSLKRACTFLGRENVAKEKETKAKQLYMASFLSSTLSSPSLLAHTLLLLLLLRRPRQQPKHHFPFPFSASTTKTRLVYLSCNVKNNGYFSPRHFCNRNNLLSERRRFIVRGDPSFDVFQAKSQ